MRIVVVGAGVMGLSAGRVLAERGHEVTVLERFTVGNPMASSSGATRIWRIAHPDPSVVRLGRWNTDLWETLEAQCGRALRLHRGLLWRGGDADRVRHAMTAAGVKHDVVDEEAQRRLFPELRWQPGRPVLWQPEAGVILAADALTASADLLSRHGGELLTGRTVLSVEQSTDGVRVVTDGDTLTADAAVVTAGPWAGQLLAGLGLDVALRPVMEQITYIRGGDMPWEIRPCLIDVPDEGGSFGLYAMPTPGVGFKVGIDEPIGEFDARSAERSPDLARERTTVERIKRDLPGLDATPLRSEVCAWTASPDHRFILDRVGDVVIGCGDSGEGFKYLPMFGQVLADLAEGKSSHPDAGTFDLRRLR